MSPINVDAKLALLNKIIKDRISEGEDENSHDLRFYTSLSNWYDAHGFWTIKQENAVDKILASSKENPTSYAETQIEKPSLLFFDGKKVSELFALAATKIKYPSIQFWRDIGELNFYLCGNLSKTPGVIRITNGQKYPNQEVYGEIYKDGKGLFRRDTSAVFKKEIQSICNSPIDEAKIRGIKTGYCCFCATPIQTKESLAVGYGPICAENYGLPWGNLPKEEVKLQEI